jgi:hypothetical protein
MCYIVHVPLNPNNQVFVKNLTRQNMRQWKTNLSMLGAQCNVGALTVSPPRPALIFHSYMHPSW